MQIGSSNDLAKQLQALQNAANGQNQGGSGFSLLMQTGGSGFGSTGSSGVADTATSGDSSSGSSSGKTGKSGSYGDALQNFMALSQASGQLTDASQQQYAAASAMASANFDTGLTMRPVGGGIPAALAS